MLAACCASNLFGFLDFGSPEFTHYGCANIDSVLLSTRGFEFVVLTRELAAISSEFRVELETHLGPLLTLLLVD